MTRRELMKAGLALGALSSTPFWAARVLANNQIELPIPNLLVPDANGQMGLTLQAGKTKWFDLFQTTTWGVEGPLLGPAIRLSRGSKVQMMVKNQLAEDVAVHWHGLEVPGNADGGPQSFVKPGGSWKAEFQVDQQAATCWFHPHTHARTGFQVAMGLGGLIIIEDEISAKLPLPSAWGADDIPVILQDKRFTEGNEIDYNLGIMEAAVGWFGDVMLANGGIYPKHIAPKGWLRFRLLNACNARSLRISTSDNRPMYVIASDGGFLAEPVLVHDLNIYTGERFEVMIDASDGKAFDLISLPVTQIGMTLPPFDKPFPVLAVDIVNVHNKGTLPDTLANMPSVPSLSGVPKRHLELSMDERMDMQGMQMLEKRFGSQALPKGMEGHMMSGGMAGMSGMHGSSNQESLDIFTSNRINGKAFQMNEPAFDVKQGQYEIWRITSDMHDMMLHPFHIHGAQFRILSENGKPVPEHRQGWKDIVLAERGSSEVLVKFNHLAPKERMYMAHCHLLEHEDTGMMMGFTVSP